MNKEKKELIYFSIKLAVFAILAIVTFLFRFNHVENLSYFIGALMTFYGVETFVQLIVFEKWKFFKAHKAYQGLIEVMFGIVVLCTNLPFSTVCIIWATWAIIREGTELYEVVTELKNWTPRVVSAVESIVAIVFSIFLIIEPGEHHALTHMYLLVVELTLAALVPLGDLLITHLKEKRKNKEIPTKE